MKKSWMRVNHALEFNYQVSHMGVLIDLKLYFYYPLHYYFHNIKTWYIYWEPIFIVHLQNIGETRIVSESDYSAAAALLYMKRPSSKDI